MLDFKNISKEIFGIIKPLRILLGKWNFGNFRKYFHRIIVFQAIIVVHSFEKSRNKILK